MNTQAGLVIVTFGILTIIVGLIVYFGGFSWFGNLPGDFRFERENFRVYVPLVSMLLVTIVLNLIFGLARRFFQ